MTADRGDDTASVPDRTSPAGLETYIAGRTLISGDGPAWADIFVQVFSRLKVQEPFLVPAVAEPLVVWVISGGALVEERDLGGEWSAKRYRRRTGYDPVHHFGHSLFPVHVGPLLRWAQRWDKVEVVEAIPRYYPSWCNWLVRVPVLREVATWNFLLILRKSRSAEDTPTQMLNRDAVRSFERTSTPPWNGIEPKVER